MPNVFVLNRIRFTPDERDRTQPPSEEFLTRLKGADGFVGSSGWERYDIPDAMLLLLEFASDTAAEAWLKTFVNSSDFHSVEASAAAGVPDVMVMLVKKQHLSEPHQSDLGSYLSLSIRIAEPGYADDLQEKLHRVFQELELLDGMTGWALGRRIDLPEEILGVGLWETFEAFGKSLPDGPTSSELRVYRRVI